MFTEADLQLGSFGADNIRAWKFAQTLSWSLRDRPLRPAVSLLGAISSGNTSAASTVLQTFNPLFPRGLYYGYIDSTGSPNATVIHPELSLTISPAVSVLATHFSFWRTSAADGIYSQPGFLLRAGNENQSRYLGSLQDLAIRWRADRHTTFEALATYYEAGAFLHESSPPGKNLSYFSLKMNYRRARPFRSEATLEGQKKFRENGGTFGGPRLDKARDASALARSNTARIRHDEFRREHTKARQAGAETSGAIADYFNDNGYLPARAPRWTAASVRAALKVIRIEDEAATAARAEVEIETKLKWRSQPSCSGDRGPS